MYRNGPSLVPKWYRLIRNAAPVPKLDYTEVVHPLVPKWSCTELVLTLGLLDGCQLDAYTPGYEGGL